MPAVTSDAQLLAVVGVVTWLISMVAAMVKGRQWVEETALAALKSEAGREAVMKMSRDHLDVKLDGISEKIGELSARINTMSNKIERRLDKFDADMQAINVRVTLLEQRESMKESV